MDFNLTPEQEQFPRGVSFPGWTGTCPKVGMKPSIGCSNPQEEWARAYKDFQRKLFEGGYAAMHYPKEYGGQGLGMMEEIIVMQVLASKCLQLRGPGIITHGMAAPTILTCGNEDQKKAFLPKILDGTPHLVPGFSASPTPVRDVANVSTRAVKDGDHYVLNGQKVWTSFAHMAEWCIILVRTDPQRPRSTVG